MLLYGYLAKLLLHLYLLFFKCAHVGINCMHFFIFSTFFLLTHSHIQQSIVLSGVYSTFPFILMAILILTGGFLADSLRRRLSTTIVRKIFTVVRKFY